MTNEETPAAQDDSERLMGLDERFVVLLRHGLAEERTAEKPDEERHLTSEGHARMKFIGRGLSEIFPKVQALYSSPLLRCVQTSMWVVKQYPKKLNLRTTDLLRPDADPAAIIQLIRGIPERRIVVVGHEPTLSLTAAQWAGLPAHTLELKKGGCYGLRLIGDEARLEWILPPRVLRRVGK